MTRYGPQPRSLAERLAARTEKSEGCWRFIGSTTPKGYGEIGGEKGQGTLRANRAAWMVAFGPIPDGLQVLHTCDNRICVRPDHLFLGTNAVNMQDKMAKGRYVLAGLTKENKLKTHCKRGHEFSPGNTYTYHGMRHCRTCANDRQRLRRAS